MRRITLVVFTVLLVVGSNAQADQNSFPLVGKMTNCGCSFFLLPLSPPCEGVSPCGEWLCFATLEVGAPEPVWTPAEPAIINAEITGEALAQCSSLYPILPRLVRFRFWVEAGGLDTVHEPDLVRSQVRGYHITDLGAP